MADTPQKQDGPQPPAQPGGFDLNHPTIISLLYLGSFVTGITGIVGIVLAYMWRDEAPKWAESHHTYLIRTFWFGLLGSLIGGVLTLVLIGIPIIIAVAVWVAIRSVMSLVNAQKQRPMPNPETLGV